MEKELLKTPMPMAVMVNLRYTCCSQLFTLKALKGSPELAYGVPQIYTKSIDSLKNFLDNYSHNCKPLVYIIKTDLHRSFFYTKQNKNFSRQNSMGWSHLLIHIWSNRNCRCTFCFRFQADIKQVFRSSLCIMADLWK